MAKVRNNLLTRHVIVRTGGKPKDGGDKMVKIPPGQTMEVEAFDAKDPFHAGLIDMGEISVDGASIKKAERTEQLKADLANAQQEAKQANDILAAAAKAAEQETDDKDKNKLNKRAHDEARIAANKAMDAVQRIEKELLKAGG